MTRFNAFLLFAAAVFAAAPTATAEEEYVLTLGRFSKSRYPMDWTPPDDPLLVRAVFLAQKAGGGDVSENFYPPLATRNAAVTREFLAAGMPVDERTGYDRTPLFYARDVETARLLLDAGAEVNAVDKHGMTPLACAANGDVTELLLARGAKVKIDDSKQEARNPLATAPDAKAVRLLLEAGAGGQEALDEALLYAANAGVTRALLAAGADVNTAAEKSYAPLLMVESPELVRMLVDAGADVSAVDDFNRTVLFNAHDPELVQILLDAGADPCHKDKDGLMSVHFARDVRSVKLLLDAIREAGVDTKTAMKACYGEGFGMLCRNFEDGKPGPRDLLALLRLLLSEGADVNTRVYRGRTPLFYARKAETVEYLLAAGARLDVRDDDDRTPLHGLSGNRPTAAAVQMLLDAGADVNAEDEDGFTPYFEADDDEIRALLRHAGAKVDEEK